MHISCRTVPVFFHKNPQNKKVLEGTLSEGNVNTASPCLKSSKCSIHSAIAAGPLTSGIQHFKIIQQHMLHFWNKILLQAYLKFIEIYSLLKISIISDWRHVTGPSYPCSIEYKNPSRRQDSLWNSILETFTFYFSQYEKSHVSS